MEHIEVTVEMHDRIMKNLGDINIIKKQRKAPIYKSFIKYTSIAACFVLLFIGAFVIYNNLTNKPPIQVVPNIVEYNSADALSDAIGFKVYEVKTFPFDVEQTLYTSFWETLAQISYTGKDKILVFRMSAGSEDNSGDYNEYSEVKNFSAGDYTVTIKGDNGQYSLAVWEYGGYTYSINIPDGSSEEEILKIVFSVQ